MGWDDRLRLLAGYYSDPAVFDLHTRLLPDIKLIEKIS